LEKNVVKRIVAIASVLLAAGALAAGSTTVASAAAKPRAGASAGVPYGCPAPHVFQNSYHGGNGQYLYNRVGSPYQLLANTAHTGYCGILDGDYYLIQVQNTDHLSICLTVEGDGSRGEGVHATACNPGDGNQIIALYLKKGTTDEYEIQFYGSTGRNCIYQDGRDSPVDVEPCNPGLTGDEWLFTD
jgi:hypothetical protein